MPEYRLVLTVDPYWIEDGANGEPLPEPREFYEENTYLRDGAPIPYDEYLRTFGDPDNYTGYMVDLEERCACCAQWAPAKTNIAFGTSFYYAIDPTHGVGGVFSEAYARDDIDLADLFDSLMGDIEEG